jgi:hypothetical protein
MDAARRPAEVRKILRVIRCRRDLSSFHRDFRLLTGLNIESRSNELNLNLMNVVSSCREGEDETFYAYEQYLALGFSSVGNFCNGIGPIPSAGLPPAGSGLPPAGSDLPSARSRLPPARSGLPPAGPGLSPAGPIDAGLPPVGSIGSGLSPESIGSVLPPVVSIVSCA